MSDQTPKLQLLSPVTVGGQTLRNRVVLAPLTRARCTSTTDPFDPVNATPNDLLVEHYAQRASGGLLVTEATAVSEMGWGWRNAPKICTPEQVAGWKRVTEAVHEKGGVMYIQLWHGGRQTHSSFHPSTGKIFAPSAIACPNAKVKTIDGESVKAEVPTEMTLGNIKDTIQEFVTAARLSKEAGFDGVELHSGNGYLIDTFFQSSTNKRTDEYGGSIENRCRFLKDVVEAIIADGSYPSERIAFHISPQGNYGDMGSDDNFDQFVGIAKIMNPLGLAYVNMQDGLGFGFHEKDKIVTCADIRKVWDGPIIGNIGLTRDVAEGMIRSGAVDMCSWGRLYMSNPDLVERFTNNWLLAPEAPYQDWWRTDGGAEGYNTYPTYTPE
mmetsp:Transcript_39105/g.76267  ORF Transcript_39105/g.76267 Transcript_39105/m.76267 type:complete len:382 (+) Transcript_39105:135-1280(+)